jgi:hypothetical protein
MPENELQIPLDGKVQAPDVQIVKKKGRPRKNPIIDPTQQPDKQVEKKKRGRKKKEKVEEEVKIKKKRGRKAAVKFFSSSIRKKIPLTTVIQDNDKSILHLDIKDDVVENNDFSFDVIKNEYEYSESNLKLTIDGSTHDISTANGKINNLSNYTKDKVPLSLVGEVEEVDELEEYIDGKGNQSLNVKEDPSDIIKLYEKRLQTRLNQDNLLIERLESLHNDDNLIEKLTNKNNDKQTVEKISKNQSNRKKGFFSLFESLYESPKWLESTDVSCWWCCHQFKTVPIGLPIKYIDNKFIVKGVFCSFACLLAHFNNLNTQKSGYRNTHSLIKFMYKKLTGTLSVPKKEDYRQMLEKSLSLDMFENQEIKSNYINALVQLTSETLEPAPPRCALKMFGGELSIEEFRNSTKEHKIFKLVEYPLSISRDYIEEVDIQNVKNINMNVFTSSTRSTNILDDKKIEEVKTRIQSSNKNNNVVTNNSIDKFIRF